MSSKTSLKVILIISIIGFLFSGYLSYMEFFHPAGCSDAIVKCSVGEEPAVNLGTIPACFYGFMMYLIIFFVAMAGLSCKKKGEKKTEDPPKEDNQS